MHRAPPARERGGSFSEAERHPGLRADARLHARLPDADRPDPAVAACRHGARPRSAGPSSGRSPPTRARSPRCRCQLRRLADRRARQRRLRRASSPGCWCATAFPAGASSTPSSTCPSRCRPRSPASRSTALYAPNGWIGQLLAPLGIKVAYHAARHRHRADLHRPALRRAHRAAGAGGDRPRGRGGRRHARRQPLADHLPRHPAARSLPAILTGFALAFARAVGEYGSVIFIAGNLPYVSEIAPLLIVIKLEEFDYAGATAIATIMLAISFAMLLVINLLQAWSRRALWLMPRHPLARGPRRPTWRPAPRHREPRWRGSSLIGDRARLPRRSSCVLPLVAVFAEAFRKGVGAYLDGARRRRTRWPRSG